VGDGEASDSEEDCAFAITVSENQDETLMQLVVKNLYYMASNSQAE